MSEPRTILYHRTRRDSAEAILREGFRDASGFYMTTEETTGVWLSDVPLDGSEGAKGDVLLRVHLSLDLDALAAYEWVEDEDVDETGKSWAKRYREWQVPADLINRHARVEVVEDEEQP